MYEIVAEIQFLIRRRPMRNYSPGALATTALWKSAPVHAWDIMPLGNIRKHKHCNYDTLCLYLVGFSSSCDWIKIKEKI